MAKRINPMAPYFVQMRELERRLILGALAAAQDALPQDSTVADQRQMAAGLLGVNVNYLRVRGHVLGGVFEGEPKHEPPTTTATKVWNEHRT